MMYCGPRGLASLVEHFNLRLTQHMVETLLRAEDYDPSCVYYLAKRNLSAVVETLETVLKDTSQIIERVKEEHSKMAVETIVSQPKKKQRRK